jgi:cytochrome c2
MKKFGLMVFSGCLVVCSIFAVGVQDASAIKQFETEFKEKYVKDGSAVPAEKTLAESVARVKCNLCHVGKKKTDRNAYGMALSELLDRKTDKDDKAKIQAALDKVAAMKSADPSGATFGDLIKQGKLPGGEE